MDDLIFHLQPHDRLAVETIEFWISKAKEAGVPAEKVMRAQDHLIQVLKWQRANWDKTKLPD